MSVVRKEVRDRAIELLEYFDTQSFESTGSRDLTEMLVEILRDGCKGYVNTDDKDLLQQLEYNLVSDEDLEGCDEELLDMHADLRETISNMQADIAIANMLEAK